MKYFSNPVNKRTLLVCLSTNQQRSIKTEASFHVMAAKHVKEMQTDVF